MIRIRADLCTGCGHCAEGCPRQAISIVNGLARIDRALCSRCGLCPGLCPRGAIVELAAVSQADMATTVGSLKQRAESLIERIERLRQRGGVKAGRR